MMVMVMVTVDHSDSFQETGLKALQEIFSEKVWIHALRWKEWR
jgi:hypothetical protein